MQDKESEIVEFKESLTQLKKGIISIVSILNKHHGGKIIFGITLIIIIFVYRKSVKENQKSVSVYIQGIKDIRDIYRFSAIPGHRPRGD